MPPTHEETSKRTPQILSVHRKKRGPKIAPVDHPRTAGHDAGFPKKEKAELTQEELKRVLKYDCKTGVFTWKVNPCKNMKSGTVAGSVHSRGYRYISIGEKKYLAHRLAWLYAHGCMPPDQVDHINGRKGDDRLINIRLANRSENQQNKYKPKSDSKSGFLGVCFSKRDKKWKAQIHLGGRNTHLGLFFTPEDAHQAYLEAKRVKHPFGML